jgi:hypothetical protein
MGEVIPFWVIAAVGLLASTWAARLAEGTAPQLTPSRLGQAVVVAAASLFAYGVLWVGKFVVFDRFLFGGAAEEPAR